MILNQYKKPKDNSQVNLQTQLVDLKHAVKELQDEQGYQWVDLHDLMGMLSALATGTGWNETASGCVLQISNILSPTNTGIRDFRLYVPGDIKVKVCGVEYEAKELKNGYQDGQLIQLLDLSLDTSIYGTLESETQETVAEFRSTSPWTRNFPVETYFKPTESFTQEEFDRLKIEGHIQRLNNEDDRPKIDYSVLDRIWGKKINMEDNDFRYVYSYFQNFLQECDRYLYDSEEPTTWQYGAKIFFTVNDQNSVTINNHTYTPTIGTFNIENISLTVLVIQDYIDSEVLLLRMDPYSLITRDLHNYFKSGIVQFKLPNDFVNLIYKRL